MQIYKSLEEYKINKHVSSIATIGTYDGVHLGHQKILDQLIQTSKATPDTESLILTFEPHPKKVLFPEDYNVPLLQTLEEKLISFEKLGIEKVLVIPFTRAFSRMTSQHFIEDILVRLIHLNTLYIGYDHRFGKNRIGGLSDLQRAAEEFNFRIFQVDAFQIDGINVSSTKIRSALLEGDIDLATQYLGQYYTFSAFVTPGNQQGRKLGFPTANLQLLDPDKLEPAGGVYAVKVEFDGQMYCGMMNIGFKPTFGENMKTIEVHLLQFDGNLYGEQLKVYFLKRIRDEKKFASISELQNQLQNDQSDCLNVYYRHHL